MEPCFGPGGICIHSISSELVLHKFLPAVACVISVSLQSNSHCSADECLQFAIWRVQKKTERHLGFSKKNWISPSILNLTHNSAHETDHDPSLGILRQNFMVNSNIGSVWSGLPGIPNCAHGPKLPVWTRNSRLQVARTILIADSDSTQNLVSVRYLWAEIQAPTRFLRFGRTGSARNFGRSLYFGPQIPEHTRHYLFQPQMLRRFRICNQNRTSYPESRVTGPNG